MGFFHDLFTPSTWAADLGLAPKPDPTLTNAITAQTAALTASTQAATAATAAATQAEQQAQLQAEAAATPPTDNESSRTAADDQLRKTLAGGVYGIGMPINTGAAPVGYRLLSGS
jgi:hypothetical protein